jgi:hypothetical protein
MSIEPFHVALFINDTHYMDIDTEPEDVQETKRKSLRVQKKPAELFECKYIACGYTTFQKSDFVKHKH